MYSYLITLDGNALVVITDVHGLLPTEYLLDWYAREYAFDRAKLGALRLPSHIKYQS